MSAIAFNEDIRDGIQEVANVAVGMAAKNIAKSFSASVKLPVPEVHLIEAVDIQMALGAVFSGEAITAVTQPFYGNSISGEALLIFTDTSMEALSALMGYEPGYEHNEVELVLEMASLLNGSCITGFCAQLDMSVLLKHPEVYGRHLSLATILQQQSFPWRQTLAIEFNYTFEGYDVGCDLILLFHEDSLPSLFENVQILID
ncbi:hypothetical protein NO559_10805 [Dasania sp. GY-MA-18]|uniref:Chemotaxis protein CheC n=1 Tax=Dasania phycosphaerae TaxID=2950436 RepID=A0A9J6RMW8_9GAMM|nr:MULTISPECIES: hypothetical protein [Dasania]MCR8923266.1 hypothetical protein [Dasania sp. GY-MA-18]MCZ0865698.1 hypothetical protein [Dasania phycosphaerae]MCZ0869423.1 hypothetical protein [Dasania phycosphaerae]